MQNKHFYVMQAIQSWCSTVNEIVVYIKRSDYRGYLYNTHIREITYELWLSWYIEKWKDWQRLKFKIVKSVSKDSEIELKKA